MDFFSVLGARVDALWQARDYDEGAFPDASFRALEEMPPCDHTALADIVQAALRANHLTPQDDLAAEFGDPPYTAFNGRGFRIEVLFWMRGVPSVHQHAFSGAFHVLEGSSIHTQWEFEVERRFDVRLMIGEVRFAGAELLKKGDNRRIIAGPSMCHATYHMDRPSITVVIRTLNEVEHNPQYAYSPPALATAPFDRLQTVIRQTQLLNLLRQVQPTAYMDQIRYLVTSKDAYSTYEFLNGAHAQLQDEEDLQQLMATAKLRHPQLTAALQNVLARDASDDKVLRARIDVGDDAELRFFLALLRNVPDGGEIARLVGERYPGLDFPALAESWLRRLSASGVFGFEFREAWFLMARYLLQGFSEQEILWKFRETDAGVSVPRTEADVAELAASLRDSWLLRSLFARGLVATPRITVAAAGTLARTG
jgi:hypothetical protein